MFKKYQSPGYLTVKHFCLTPIKIGYDFSHMRTSKIVIKIIFHFYIAILNRLPYHIIDNIKWIGGRPR